MNTNPFYLARTLHNRNGFQSVKQVFSDTGISQSLLGDLEAGSSRKVGYQTVRDLAKHYGVTTDYLLGLDDVHTRDGDLQGACHYTGLSEDAVRALRSFKEQDSFSEILSRILTNEKMLYILVQLSASIKHSRLATEMPGLQILEKYFDNKEEYERMCKPLLEKHLVIDTPWRASLQEITEAKQAMANLIDSEFKSDPDGKNKK